VPPVLPIVLEYRAGNSSGLLVEETANEDNDGEDDSAPEEADQDAPYDEDCLSSSSKELRTSRLSVSMLLLLIFVV